jgi:fibro-slime domain-containing protein
MKSLLGNLKNSKGVVMVIAMLVLLAITAVGLGMITNAGMSSTIGKNYKSKLQSFYAADGQMTVLGQVVLDSLEPHFFFPVNVGSSGAVTKNTIVDCRPGEQQTGNEGPKSYDSDTTASRWASNGTLSRDSIEYDLGSADTISQVRVRFESYTTELYQIHIDIGTGSSYATASYTTAWSGWTSLVRTSDYWIQPLPVTVGRFVKVKMFANSNNNGWFSIIDFQVWKYPSATSSTIVDTLFPKSSMTMSATSTHGGNGASNSIDNNSGTKWESSYSDPQRLYADCGNKVNISKVVIDWDVESAKTYMIQGSNDAVNWIDLAEHTDYGTTAHRMDTIKGLSGSYEFIGVNGVTRNTANGYGINEFNLYASYTPTLSSTSYFGGVPVAWTLTNLGTNQFNLQTRAYMQNSKWGTIFQTPLRQFISRGGGGLVNGGAVKFVPVTFYDYHSDRRNPEFEQPCVSQVNKNMVGVHLDSERKPVVGTSPCLNYFIAKWFRPWQPGDYTIPVYHYTTLQYTTVDSTANTKTLVRWLRPGAWNSGEWGNCSANEVTAFANCTNPKTETTSPLYDGAYANVVLLDSLPFKLTNAATGTYQYNNGGFFILDNRGFGNEWNTNDQKANNPNEISKNADGSWSHNYSFTMEIKYSFLKVPNLRFDFTGDDDIWLFINNTLQMDLGGPHTASSETVLIDTIPGLQNLQIYNFDFFYCERHSSNSTINIQTNILQLQPVTTSQRHWSRDYGSLN